MCVGCGILGSGAELETIVHWPMHSLLVGWMGECLHIICIGIGVLLLTQEVWWLEYELILFFLLLSKSPRDLREQTIHGLTHCLNMVQLSCSSDDDIEAPSVLWPADWVFVTMTKRTV